MKKYFNFDDDDQVIFDYEKKRDEVGNEDHKLLMIIIQKEQKLSSLKSELSMIKGIRKLLKSRELSRKIEKTSQEIEELKKKRDNVNKELYNSGIVKKINALPHYVILRNELRRNAIYEDGILTIDGTTSLDKSVINLPLGDKFSLDDIALVHASNNFPKNGIIRSAKGKKLCTTNGIVVYQHRATTHFSLNGRVGNHAEGNWDKMPIIIIEPIKSHVDKTKHLLPADTFYEGDFHLSEDAIIMVHESIFDTVPDEIKDHYKVVKFTGSNIVATQKMLLMLGYRPQTVGKDNWENDDNAILFKKYIEKNYPEKDLHGHSFSGEQSVEKCLQARDIALARIRGEKFIDSINGISNISLEELMKMWIIFCEGNIRCNNEDFDLFVNYCLEHGIIIKDDRITFISATDTLALLKEKDKKIKDMQGEYQKIFSLILSTKEKKGAEHFVSAESILLYLRYLRSLKNNVSEMQRAFKEIFDDYSYVIDEMTEEQLKQFKSEMINAGYEDKTNLHGRGK